AIRLYWGSMADARRALGLVELPAPRQRWSRASVLRELGELHRAGQHLSTTAMIEAGRKDLLIAAIRYVGSWQRARDLVGARLIRRRAVPGGAWDASSVIEA